MSGFEVFWMAMAMVSLVFSIVLWDAASRWKQKARDLQAEIAQRFHDRYVITGASSSEHSEPEDTTA